MMPTPAPAPPMPMQAIPAPMYFAAIGSMKRTPCLGLVRRSGSVARMDGVVDVDDGEDGEDVSLQKRDQHFERAESDHHRERQHGAEITVNAEARQHRNEAREHRERDVTREHVCEQPHRVRDRPQEEREHLDEYDQRQDEDRNAAWHEQLEEFQAVLVEAVD